MASTPSGNAALRKTVFAHQSEQMFANLLDFYRIAWEYEPRSFPISTGPNGEALEAFTPDFYLPEFKLYVELTTMKQSLVTKKNRKVRLLRELYPDLNIQVPLRQRSGEPDLQVRSGAKAGGGMSQPPPPGDSKKSCSPKRKSTGASAKSAPRSHAPMPDAR